MSNLLGLVLGLVLRVHTYGGGQSLNAGVVWQSPTPGVCLGYEVRGVPGLFGNGVLGLHGEGVCE